MSSHALRARGKGALPPLRTFTELAEELGLSAGHFAKLLSDPAAPKPVLRSRSLSNGRNTYYEPNEVRKWFKTLNRK